MLGKGDVGSCGRWKSLSVIGRKPNTCKDLEVGMNVEHSRKWKQAHVDWNSICLDTGYCQDWERHSSNQSVWLVLRTASSEKPHFVAGKWQDLEVVQGNCRSGMKGKAEPTPASSMNEAGAGRVCWCSNGGWTGVWLTGEAFPAPSPEAGKTHVWTSHPLLTTLWGLAT